MLGPIKYKEMCRRVSEKHELDQELVNSIVLDTFYDLKEKMTEFKDLRYSLKGLFILYYRKNKLERLLDTLEKLIDGRIVLKYTSFNAFPYDRDPHELRNKILRLLGRYEKFIETKNNIREHNKRYKESRQNYLEECERFSSGEHENAISGNDS